MKAALLLFLSGLASASAPVLACNQQLMESYDLDGQPTTLPDTNVFCPQVTDNCCSYSTQLSIYKKWVVKREADKIADFYDKFSKAYALIFDQFAVIEKIAEKVAQETEQIPGSNCNFYAGVILRYRISEMRESVAAQVKRTFKFLLQSRKGFYCTLCNAELHPFFNRTAQQFSLDYSFCSALADNTLNYLLFRYKFFVKVARLYSQFLMNCDLFGRFRPDLLVSNDVKFFRKDAILAHLETCRRGYNKPGAMAACENFCRHFNPVKYDQMFEGEIDRLYALEGFMKRRIRVLRLRQARELQQQKESDLSPKRILEEKESAQTPPQEFQNEINSFNREFKTVLAIHHPYRFRYDTSIKYHTSFDESLFEPGVERVYDLVDFKPQVHPRGIDFFAEGDVVIDREGAMRAFELLNPEKRGAFDFEDFLKK